MTEPQTQRLPTVGVLFVHGMGGQERGETLDRFGAPLCRWMQSWIDGSPFPRHVVVTRAAPQDPFAPSHLVYSPEWTDAAGRRYAANFLLAEAWWAEDFRQAGFVEMVPWSVAVAPWMLERFGRRRLELFRRAVVRRDPGDRPFAASVFGLAVYFFLAPVASFVFQVVIAALLLLGRVPKLGGVAAAGQRRLSGSFGDPYLLITNPVRYGQMVSRVQQTVVWLAAEGCERIVVVAHSQGALVAHEALRRIRMPVVGDPIDEELWAAGRRRVRRFVTLGNPFARVHAIRCAQPVQDRLLARSIVRYLGMALVAAGVVREGVGAVWDFKQQPADLIQDGAERLQGWFDRAHSAAWNLPGFGNWYPDDLLFANAFVTLGAIVFLVPYVVVPLVRWGRVEVPDLEPGDLWLDGLVPPGDPDAERGLVWTDYYAAADPFPDGPLFHPADPSRCNAPDYRAVSSNKVHNEDSVQNDHSQYEDNPEQFVGALAYHVVGVAGAGFDQRPGDQELLGIASRRRVARVAALLWAGVLTTVAVVLAWLGLGGDDLAGLAEDVGAGARRVADAFPLLDGDEIGEEFANTGRGQRVAIGMAVVAAAGALYFRWLVKPLWRRWDRRQADDTHRRVVPGLLPARALGFIVAASLLPIAVSVATAARYRPGHPAAVLALILALFVTAHRLWVAPWLSFRRLRPGTDGSG